MSTCLSWQEQYLKQNHSPVGDFVPHNSSLDVFAFSRVLTSIRVRRCVDNFSGVRSLFDTTGVYSFQDLLSSLHSCVEDF